MGMHERELELAEEQPAGRLAYENVRDPFPPLVETKKAILCPKSELAGVNVNDFTEGSVYTGSVIGLVSEIVPRLSDTVQTAFIIPEALYV